MKTTQETLENIESQLSELLSYLKPKTEPDKEDKILSEMKLLQDKIETFNSKKEVQTDLEYESTRMSDSAFEKRRNYFVIAALMITAAASWIAFLNFLSLFSVMFGYFISIGGLAFVLVFDYYVLPGNTIKRISQNAVGAAIIILGFIILTIAGAGIGNSLITNRERAEEYQPASSRTIEQPRPEPKQLPKIDTSTKEN